jgi:hypothetical protein
MKRQVLLLLLLSLFNIYDSKTVKKISITGLNDEHNCDSSYIFTFSINAITSGFASEENINLPLQEPEFAIAICTVPKDEISTVQKEEISSTPKITCKLNSLQFPFKEKIKFTTNVPSFGGDIEVEGWENLQGKELAGPCFSDYQEIIEPQRNSKFTCKSETIKLWEVELLKTKKTEIENTKSNDGYIMKIYFLVDGVSVENTCNAEIIEQNSTVEKLMMRCELDGKVTKTKFHTCLIFSTRPSELILVNPSEEYISDVDCTKQPSDSASISSIYCLGILLLILL